MTRYLTQLVDRALGVVPTLQPRPRSTFEPVPGPASDIDAGWLVRPDIDDGNGKRATAGPSAAGPSTAGGMTARDTGPPAAAAAVHPESSPGSGTGATAGWSPDPLRPLAATDPATPSTAGSPSPVDSRFLSPVESSLAATSTRPGPPPPEPPSSLPPDPPAPSGPTATAGSRRLVAGHAVRWPHPVPLAGPPSPAGPAPAAGQAPQAGAPATAIRDAPDGPPTATDQQPGRRTDRASPPFAATHERPQDVEHPRRQLTPEALPPPPPRATAALTPGGPPRAAASADPPRITVTIGRVEVRPPPLPPEPAPIPQSPPGIQPLSLDEYLDRRT